VAEVQRVRRTRRGDYQIKLPEGERDVLRALPGQLKQLLSSDDPGVRRLFPPAYEDDPELNAEYEELVRGDLIAGRERSLDVFEATLDAKRRSEEEVVAWLGAINDLRLFLGTRLDVTEDLYEEGVPEDHPQGALFALFLYLGWLQEQVVEALSPAAR
jgi:hypothetical protein